MRSYIIQNLNAKLPLEYPKISIIVSIMMAFVVIIALGFEHIGGYIPCALCLEQRIAYYMGAPLMVIAGMASYFTAPTFLVRGLVFIAGILMIYNAVLGFYHSGVEWYWWPGPESCGAAADGLSLNAADLLSDINNKIPPSCDKAALRVFGLSFAGWNVIASSILAFFTLRFAMRKISN